MKTLQPSPVISLFALLATIGLVIASSNAQQDANPTEDASGLSSEVAEETSTEPVATQETTNAEPNTEADTPAEVSAWDSLANSSIESFEPVDEAKLDEVRSQLASKASAVERLLNPNSQLGKGWLDYLAWDGIQSQITSGSEPDLAAANKTLARLHSGAEGLENGTMRGFTEALEEYVSVANFARAKDNQAMIYKKQVDALVGLLNDADLGNARDSYEVERRLDLLSEVGSSELLDSIHTEYGYPNVMIDASSDLLVKVVNRSVDECKPVTDCILGTSIRGTGCTEGELIVSMLPADESAMLGFTLSGITNSTTRGVNGPVAIYSNGLTTFSVSKSISLSDDAFHAYPASASATTKTTTRSIKKIGGGFGAKFIEMIAEKKVKEKRGRADAIASNHAEDRYEDAIDEEIDEKIYDARQDYLDKFKKPLARRGASPQSVSYSTTAESLHVNLTQATEAQLAAPDTAPTASLEHSLSARVHQSAVNNFLAASLGGAKLAKQDANGEATMSGKIKPDWMEKDDEEEDEPNDDFKPWKIKFRDTRPVSCEISPGEIAVTIHTKVITVGDETFKGWDLTAKFAPEQIDGEWKLVRKGPIDMLPTSFDPRAGKGMRSQQLALRANLNKAINEPEDRLPMEIDINEIDLSDKDSQLESLTLESIELFDGWVSLGWHAE